MKLKICINIFLLNCINILSLQLTFGSAVSNGKRTPLLVAKIVPKLAPLDTYRVYNMTRPSISSRDTFEKFHTTQHTFPQQQQQQQQQQQHHKFKRESPQAQGLPLHFSPTFTTKLKRVTLFEEDNVSDDNYDEAYDLNKDVVESMGYTTTYKPPIEISRNKQFPPQKFVLSETHGEECHPTLSSSDIRWKKGSTLLIAFLPHVEPSSCNPPLRCSVSTTIHRHISLQEGDSLQVVLQKVTEPSPAATTTTSYLHPDFPEEGSVQDNKNEKKFKEPLIKSDNLDTLSAKKRNETNSTHLFSREEHHLKFSSGRLDTNQRQEKLAVLEEQTQGKLLRKRQTYNVTSVNHGKNVTNTALLTNEIDDLSLTVWKVTRSEWASCSTREGGQVAKSSNDGKVTLGQEIMATGTHYFIGRSSWSSSECFKLKVLVRGADCGEGSICSGKGICFTNTSMDEYNCGCCDGYGGKHCEEKDACVKEPCLNAGICLDIQEGHDGATFQCLCPYGFRGKLCETPSSLCDSNPCQNGGLCEGNHTYYACRCASGWTGTHCLEKMDTVYSTEEQRYDLNSHYDDESSRNDPRGGCANGPCVHGVCVETTAQDFRCFCQQGFGGERCEMEYDECNSNPCPNGGTCVDQIGSYQCLCGPGYTGPNCLTKVNMCAPDPCAPNRVCKDKGNSFSCDCVPGLSDDDCGIRDQVCSPNPCLHGGTCYTIAETLSFYCACRPGFTGQTCQDASILESVGPYGTGEPIEDLDLHHHHASLSNPLSHLKNIYTGAITLACAFIIFLLVVSICHCRLNRPYSKCCYLPIKRPPLRFFSRSSSLREKLRRERTSVRLESDPDGASTSMTSPSNSDNVFYNMDVCDNQELPLIK